LTAESELQYPAPTQIPLNRLGRLFCVTDEKIICTVPTSIPLDVQEAMMFPEKRPCKAKRFDLEIAELRPDEVPGRGR
jgi:hypothetical protein